VVLTDLIVLHHTVGASPGARSTGGRRLSRSGLRPPTWWVERDGTFFEIFDSAVLGVPPVARRHRRQRRLPLDRDRDADKADLHPGFPLDRLVEEGRLAVG
jgi:hypothetical protein